MISKGRVIRTGLFFAIANFLLTAIIGVLLRYNTLFPISGLTDRYWIHAHSHIGFLGWVFMALTILGFALLLPKSAKINRRVYRLMVYVQVSIIGMLATFPFMGYAAPSILFSTFHMALSFAFVWVFYKHSEKQQLSNRFMKAGLIFMLVSGIGPLALGPIIIGGYRGTDWYDMAIYFYLHFQYNGWFTLAVFALVLKVMEQFGIQINEKRGNLLFRLLVLGTIMTLTLSALGFESIMYLRVFGAIGALLQLWGGFILLKMIFDRNDLPKVINSKWVKWFFGIALFSWLLKIMMQFLSAIPLVTDFVYLSRDAIMTYLHLSFLGFTSCFIIGLLILKNYLKTNTRIARLGYVVFIVSIVMMELTIGLRSIPQYLNLEFYTSINILLFAESLILLLSISIILFYGFILSSRVVKQKS